MHALGPLESQCLRGFLGLFLERKPQERNNALDLPSPEKLLPSTIPEETNAELKS